MKNKNEGIMKCFDMNVDTNIRIETVSAKLKQMARIDEVDDERRNEHYEKEDKLFSEIVKEVDRTGNRILHNLLMQYIELIRRDRQKVLYIENLDDTMRNNILEYLKKTEEEFYRNQHQLELGLIKENMRSDEK